MNPLLGLLDWLAVGGALSQNNADRCHDALALRLDADRHAVANIRYVLTDPDTTLSPAARRRLEVLEVALEGPVHETGATLPAHARYEADELLEARELAYRDNMLEHLEAVRDYLKTRAASGDAQACGCNAWLEAFASDFLVKDTALAFVAGEIEPFERGDSDWLRPDVEWLCLSARLHKALIGEEL
jgi:hypothetical protein